jgi:hypothetical protein
MSAGAAGIDIRKTIFSEAYDTCEGAPNSIPPSIAAENPLLAVRNLVAETTI